MKKSIFIIYLMTLLLIFWGCSHRDGDYQSTPTNPQSAKISYFHADWPEYQSLDLLVAAASNVFEGKITNIFFEVIDLHTGELAEKDSESAEPFLYTIYEVEIGSSLKGENSEKTYVKVIGGMPGYKETEQCEKMKEYKIYNDELGILVLDCFEPLTIGNSYLFLTEKQASAYHEIINGTQFAYAVGETENTGIFGYEAIKAYVSDTSKNEKS